MILTLVNLTVRNIVLMENVQCQKYLCTCDKCFQIDNGNSYKCKPICTEECINGNYYNNGEICDDLIRHTRIDFKKGIIIYTIFGICICLLLIFVILYRKLSGKIIIQNNTRTNEIVYTIV